jgi:hypothetical protein
MAAPTLEKVDSGDFEWRDVWQLVEYLQQFSDALEEMENDPPPIAPATDTNEIVETILEQWYG